jgi:hypothetical protein
VAIEGPKGEEIARALRSAGVTAALHAPGADPEDYAIAWGYAHVVMDEGGGTLVVKRPGGGAASEVVLAGGSAGDIVRAISAAGGGAL